VFENGILRRIFGPVRDEVTGECGKAQRKETTRKTEAQMGE
jgi:hypothetical protein